MYSTVNKIALVAFVFSMPLAGAWVRDMSIQGNISHLVETRNAAVAEIETLKVKLDETKGQLTSQTEGHHIAVTDLQKRLNVRDMVIAKLSADNKVLMSAGPKIIEKEVVKEKIVNSCPKSFSYIVPRGYKKVRVRGWNPDGSVDLDRTLSVSPGQKFRVEAVK